MRKQISIALAMLICLLVSASCTTPESRSPAPGRPSGIVDNSVTDNLSPTRQDSLPPKYGSIPNLADILSLSNSHMTDYLANYHLKESDPAPAYEVGGTGGKIRIYDLGNGMELQLRISGNGQVGFVKVSHLEGQGLPIAESPTLLQRFGLIGLGEPTSKASLGWHWFQIHGTGQTDIFTVADATQSVISYLEISDTGPFNKVSKSSANSVPEIAPTLPGEINLPALMGQSRESLTSTLTGFPLKDRDVALPSDPLYPSGEVRIYDAGDRMELVIFLTRDDQVACAAMEETESLRCRLEDSGRLLSRFGISDLGQPLVKAPIAWRWRQIHGSQEWEISTAALEDSGYIWQVQIRRID